MTRSNRKQLACTALLLATSVSLHAAEPAPSAVEFSQSKELFGGQPALIMRRHRTGDGSRPEFLSVTMLPGRGMDVLQITADIPGRGESELLDSPPLAEAAKIFGGPEDQFGNQAFHMGSAFLIPFANRMLGDLPRQDGPVNVPWNKSTLHLIPNAPPARGRSPLRHPWHAQRRSRGHRLPASGTRRRNRRSHLSLRRFPRPLAFADRR